MRIECDEEADPEQTKRDDGPKNNNDVDGTLKSVLLLHDFHFNFTKSTNSNIQYKQGMECNIDSFSSDFHKSTAQQQTIQAIRRPNEPIEEFE